MYTLQKFDFNKRNQRKHNLKIRFILCNYLCKIRITLEGLLKPKTLSHEVIP